MANLNNPLDLSSLDGVLVALIQQDISYDQATRTILVLNVQGKITDKEIEEKTKTFSLQGRNLYNELTNVSLRSDDGYR